MSREHLCRSPLIFGLAVAVTAWVAIPSAWGHGLSVFAWREAGRVLVESKFSGGKRPFEAAVQVLDAQGHELLSGKTDADGRWAFDLPPGSHAQLTIVLEAGLGHRAEWTLTSADLGTAAMDEAQESEAAANVPVSVPAESAGLSRADLQRLLTEALAPIDARLARLEKPRQGPTLQDILGGLGYIIGLVGVAAYVRARRLRPGDDTGRR